MFIVICMTVETERRRFTVLGTGIMAVFAGSFPVRPRQDKIGQLMIEQLRVEPDNIRGTPHMLGMACCALLYIGIPVATVIPDSIPYIKSNVLVTGFAQGSLLIT